MSLFIRTAAGADILRHAERYAAQRLPHIARRFLASVIGSIDALSAAADAGSPRIATNPALAGMRAWPIKGFDHFRIYYLADAEQLTVVRVLHGKRDIGMP